MGRECRLWAERRRLLEGSVEDNLERTYDQREGHVLITLLNEITYPMGLLDGCGMWHSRINFDNYLAIIM